VSRFKLWKFCNLDILFVKNYEIRNLELLFLSTHFVKLYMVCMLLNSDGLLVLNFLKSLVLCMQTRKLTLAIVVQIYLCFCL